MRVFSLLADPILLQKHRKSCRRRKSSFRSSCRNRSNSDSSSSNRSFGVFAILTLPSTTNLISNNHNNHRSSRKILRNSLKGPQRNPRTRTKRRIKRRQVVSGGSGTSRLSISIGRNPQEAMAVDSRLRLRLRTPPHRDTITPLLLEQQQESLCSTAIT